jgi:Ran GTPase-activating protein (RanGAP) involved in mRNA processing and transport
VPAEDTTEASFTLTCAPALLDRIVALLLLALLACQQMEQVGVSPVAFGVNVRPTGAR